MRIEKDDLNKLRLARDILENPGLAARIGNMIGTPLERGLALLPKKWSSAVNEATSKALLTALKTALLTMDKNSGGKSFEIWHKIAVIASGAGGGAFGLTALALELPVSTTIILRSIADIARSEGEDLNMAEPRLACLEVLALGGRNSRDDATESGYFTVRASLAKARFGGSRIPCRKRFDKRRRPGNNTADYPNFQPFWP